ncbi:hypothetical protein FACS189450_01590 [Spirochaetia bacterium]|nr:hypothetical protein FACS189450_01590 [Spirochaetia bacterium]
MFKPSIPLDRVKIALLGMQRYSWEQGVAMQAFLEQGDMELTAPMAVEAVNRQILDGRSAVLGGQTAVTDPCAPGEALLAAWKYTGDPVLKAGCDRLLEWALHGAPRNAAGLVYHLTDKPQIWVDSFYMLPPFLAAAGHYPEALLNLYGYWDILFDREAKLLRHIWDDGAKVFTRPFFWGVGNGWALAGIARVYDLLPPEYAADREKLSRMGTTLIESALTRIRGDGLFHDILDDPGSFVETNFAQMLAYTIYRGINSKWLAPSFLAHAEKMRRAAEEKVDGHGFVQGVCGAPSFDKPGIAPEGQAFFILMEAAAKKYYNHPA